MIQAMDDIIPMNGQTVLDRPSIHNRFLTELTATMSELVSGFVPKHDNGLLLPELLTPLRCYHIVKPGLRKHLRAHKVLFS
jgi:hypothetical protein